MSDPALLALAANTLLNLKVTEPAPPTSAGSSWNVNFSSEARPALPSNVSPDRPIVTEFAQPSVQVASVPQSGGQLYRQRLEALRVGKIYTRLPAHSFSQTWKNLQGKPTYQQWRQLLALEARAVARGQGNQQLAVMVGDSLSLWYPSDRLPPGTLWLNQAISGETTREILRRLGDFDQVRPQVIYVMAGVNDLKQGASDNDILWNLRRIVWRLQQRHPQSQIIVQSILPTRSPQISSERIWRLNRQLAAIAREDGAEFLDLYSYLADAAGSLRPDLTTDGIHLNRNGYAAWQEVLTQTSVTLARSS